MEEEIIVLPPFVCDDIHIDGKEVDGHNKPFNYIISCRGPGKSTLLWRKIYNAFRRDNMPSIILKRRQVDITDQDITDAITLLEDFVGTRLPLKWSKGDIKQGMMDVYLNGKIFVRYIALNSPLDRIKSKVLAAKYMMFDEFICNLRKGEKYLAEEPFIIDEVYSTYTRATFKKTGKPLKAYFFANPYSLYSPHMSWRGVNAKDLYPGAIVTGQNYVVQCYQIKPELAELIKQTNPLFEEDSEYKKYAFDGRSINDENIRLVSEQPPRFKLYYIFKIHGKYLGIYIGYEELLQLQCWCQMLPVEQISKRRDILCFDFGQMQDGSILLSAFNKKVFTSLKRMIEYRAIAFRDIECSYLMEEIYANL